MVQEEYFLPSKTVRKISRVNSCELYSNRQVITMKTDPALNTLVYGK